MNVKKLLGLGLVLALASVTTACSSGTESSPLPETTTSSTEETTEAATAPASSGADTGEIAAASLSSGSISIDGDIFVLGKSFSEVTGAWSLSPEDAEKYKDYSLNPMTTSGSGMGIYKETYGTDFTSFHHTISLMNDSDAPIPYLDGAIDYLAISGISRFDSVAPAVFPGGLTLESSKEDFIAAYGEPTHEYNDEETGFSSAKFEDGDVTLEVNWVNGAIDDITLTI